MDKNVEEISAMVGFANRQSFYAAFYKNVGETPNGIVREIKKRNKSIICYIIIKKKENNCFPFFVSAHELCIYKKR